MERRPNIIFLGGRPDDETIRRMGLALGETAHLRDLPSAVPPPPPRRPFTPPPINGTWGRGRFLSDRARLRLQLVVAIATIVLAAAIGSRLG